MAEYISRKELENLRYLIDKKLQKITKMQHHTDRNDPDVLLTEHLLKFVDFLASKEMRLAEQYQHSQYAHPFGLNPPSPNTHTFAPNTWTTSTDISTYGAAQKPSTICDVCWRNCGGKHTHCTHMLSSSLSND